MEQAARDCSGGNPPAIQAPPNRQRSPLAAARIEERKVSGDRGRNQVGNAGRGYGTVQGHARRISQERGTGEGRDLIFENPLREKIENPERQQRHQERDDDLRLHCSTSQRLDDPCAENPQQISGRVRLVFEEIELGHAASVLRGVPIEGEARAEIGDVECQPQDREGEEDEALSGGHVSF